MTAAPIIDGAVQLDDLPPGLWTCAPSVPVVVVDGASRPQRLYTCEGMTTTGARGAVLVVTSAPASADALAAHAGQVARGYLEAADRAGDV